MIVKPWEKQKGEQGKAFEAFQVYLELGHVRDLETVAAKTGMPEASIKSWYSSQRWKSRVEAWDAFVQEAHRKALVPALNKSSDEWAQRRISISDNEYELAEKLRQKALDMIAMSLHEREVKQIDEKTGLPVTIIIKPMKWTLRDAIEAAKIYSELSRRSAGMTLNKNQVDVSVNSTEEKIENARQALDKLREEMAATLKDAELMEMLRRLPQMVASRYGIKVTDLITDGGYEEPVPSVDGELVE